MLRKMITTKQLIAPSIVFSLTLYGILLYQDIQSAKVSEKESAKVMPVKATMTFDTSKKKLLENAEKASFDEMSAEANTKVNLLGSEINAINRKATIETTKMYQESTINPLDTGFIQGRSFLIAQNKNKKTIEVYKKQIAILEALLRHPYATKAPETTILKSTIISLQNKSDSVNLEAAELNVKNQKKIASDARAVREYAQKASIEYQQQMLKTQAARDAMITNKISAR